jgi:predicted transglutaminase-like cysteine proteinase
VLHAGVSDTRVVDQAGPDCASKPLGRDRFITSSAPGAWTGPPALDRTELKHSVGAFALVVTTRHRVVRRRRRLVEAKFTESYMSRTRSLNTWHAIVLAWGLSLICVPTEVLAGTPTSKVDRADEPFGLPTSTVTMGAVLEKWLGVKREVDNERLVLRICEENFASCQSQAALQFLAIVDSARGLEGRARLGEINRAINLKIRPMSDQALYGAEDVWSPPLATLAKGAGDCEDYAIAKFVALQEAGVSADDLRIVILRDDVREEDHAVVAARLDGNWLILDSRHFVMSEDQQVQDYYRPVFVIDHDGVKRYSGASSASEGARGLEPAVGQILR